MIIVHYRDLSQSYSDDECSNISIYYEYAFRYWTFDDIELGYDTQRVHTDGSIKFGDKAYLVVVSYDTGDDVDSFGLKCICFATSHKDKAETLCNILNTVEDRPKSRLDSVSLFAHVNYYFRSKDGFEVPIKRSLWTGCFASYNNAEVVTISMHPYQEYMRKRKRPASDKSDKLRIVLEESSMIFNIYYKNTAIFDKGFDAIKTVAYNDRVFAEVYDRFKQGALVREDYARSLVACKNNDSIEIYSVFAPDQTVSKDILALIADGEKRNYINWTGFEKAVKEFLIKKSFTSASKGRTKKIL